jgi:replicative superfamily II helicase
MRGLIFVFVTLLTISTVKTSLEKPINSVTPISKLNFYNYGPSKLAEFVAEQQMIGLMLQRANEIGKRLKEERKKEIYRKRLANQIKSSFIRDFITLRH